MIHVIAILTAKAGMRDAIIARVQENLSNVLAEEGCIEYRPLIDSSADESGFGPDTLVIVEKWQDEQCLKNHAASEHMKQYGEQVKAFIAERDIRILRDI